MKRFIYILLLSLFALQANAQFSVEGQFRPRFESRNGYKQLRSENTTASNFMSQRTRLKFNYKMENIEFRAAFQDVHIWGDISPKTIESGYIGLHEGWAKIKFGEAWFTKIGRQELYYDNGRLITHANWNQVGFTHDVIKVGYKKHNFNFETVFGYNQKGSNFGNAFYDGVAVYKGLNVVWLSYKMDNWSFALLNLADLKQKNDSTYVDYVRNTIGPIIKYKNNNTGFAARGYYQGGRTVSGTKVSAYYLNADVNTKLSSKFKGSLGFELKSGNDALNTTNTVDNSFDILYGARHKFNGFIDYFHIPSTTKGAGLVDYYAKLDFAVTEKMSLGAYYHLFTLQNNYVDASNQVIDKLLGNELDVVAKFSFNKFMKLDMGLATIWGTESLEVIKGGDKDLFPLYGYAMLTIKPTLFKQK